MNINDLFKRPSFNFIASQGWMFFILLMAGIFAGLISPWNNTIFMKTFSFIFWSFCFLPYLIIYTFIIQAIILLSKKHKSIINKYFFLFNILFMVIPFYYLQIDDRYTTAGSWYSFMMLITGISIIIVFIVLTILPYIVCCYIEKKKNTIINPVFTQSKFVLWGALIGTFLYILISLTCIIFTCGIFLIS